MFDPADKIEEQNVKCPDKVGDPCTHHREGFCTLSKYFNCIEEQSQVFKPTPKPKPKTQNQNQDGNSKANPSYSNIVDKGSGVSSPKGSPAPIHPLQPLSYSQVQDFAHCHRKWWWSRRIQSVELSLPALKGQCGHEILQYIHTAEQPELAGINAIVDTYQDLLSPSSSTLNPSLEVLKPLGWAYLEVYQDKLFKGETEAHFETEGLHGYLDMIQYGDENGARIGWEFKFSSDLDNLTTHGLGLQLGVYFLGNPSLQRIVVRVCRFPDLQRRKNETLDEYLDRTYKQIKQHPNAYFKDMHFWREEINLEEIKEEVRRIRQDIAIYESEKEGQLAHYKDRLSCSAPFECEFLPLCSLGVKNWHDSPVTEALYKEREGRKDGHDNSKDLREQRNWENDFELGGEKND